MKRWKSRAGLGCTALLGSAASIAIIMFASSLYKGAYLTTAREYLGALAIAIALYCAMCISVCVTVVSVEMMRTLQGARMGELAPALQGVGEQRRYLIAPEC